MSPGLVFLGGVAVVAAMLLADPGEVHAAPAADTFGPVVTTQAVER